MISINYEGSHGQAHGCVKNCPPLWVVRTGINALVRTQRVVSVGFRTIVLMAEPV